jgi:hypothetical protein
MTVMITTDKINTLANFPSASWAVWSDDFGRADCIEATPDNIYEFILGKAVSLKDSIVFLGLNRSRVATSHRYQNFHAVGHRGDHTLKRYIQEEGLCNLHGGYMTDLNATDVTPNGNDVRVAQADISQLVEQLRILGQSSFKVICFGNRTFEALAKGLGCGRRMITSLDVDILTFCSCVQRITLEVFSVWHYSNRGYNNRKVIELNAQLDYLNKL